MRPQKDRIVTVNPQISYFKPRGIPLYKLEEVRLTVDEREAIRLADLLDMSHEEAGRRMGISRATFGRILQRGRKAVADALLNGKAINVEGGSYKIVDQDRVFLCRKCAHEWTASAVAESRVNCPCCKHEHQVGDTLQD